MYEQHRCIHYSPKFHYSLKNALVCVRRCYICEKTQLNRPTIDNSYEAI